jgi:hypothetical protein
MYALANHGRRRRRAAGNDGRSLWYPSVRIVGAPDWQTALSGVPL